MRTNTCILVYGKKTVLCVRALAQARCLGQLGAASCLAGLAAPAAAAAGGRSVYLGAVVAFGLGAAHELGRGGGASRAITTALGTCDAGEIHESAVWVWVCGRAGVWVWVGYSSPQAGVQG
jgi:hypothetical protein